MARQPYPRNWFDTEKKYPYIIPASDSKAPAAGADLKPSPCIHTRTAA